MRSVSALAAVKLWLAGRHNFSDGLRVSGLRASQTAKHCFMCDSQAQVSQHLRLWNRFLVTSKNISTKQMPLTNLVLS